MGLSSAQCVQLMKAIYGLAEAPRYWWRRLGTDLLALGWESLATEPCLYVYRAAAGLPIGLL
eukprot:6390925-Alexandrium_andersonii.AAC.1